MNNSAQRITENRRKRANYENPHTKRWSRRSEIRTKQPPKCCANTTLPMVERHEEARTALVHTHASTQLLCSMNRVTFLSQMLSTDREKKTVARFLDSSFARPSAHSILKKCRFPINLLSSIHPIRFWYFAA